ncbi:MAG: CxxC-x17-CxxC domain-containing protein [Dehalococcoidia bacterium]
MSTPHKQGQGEVARSYEPGRCAESRQSRRQDRSGSSGRAPRERTQVTCAACGKETEVPFVPRTGRPVYCDDCFTKERDQR